MATIKDKDVISLGVRCPNCENENFFFAGIQYGHGFVPDMKLWTCVACGSTFSKAVMETLAGAANEL